MGRPGKKKRDYTKALEIYLHDTFYAFGRYDMKSINDFYSGSVFRFIGKVFDETDKDVASDLLRLHLKTVEAKRNEGWTILPK